MGGGNDFLHGGAHEMAGFYREEGGGSVACQPMEAGKGRNPQIYEEDGPQGKEIGGGRGEEIG